LGLKQEAGGRRGRTGRGDRGGVNQTEVEKDRGRERERNRQKEMQYSVIKNTLASPQSLLLLFGTVAPFRAERPILLIFQTPDI